LQALVGWIRRRFANFFIVLPAVQNLTALYYRDNNKGICIEVSSGGRKSKFYDPSLPMTFFDLAKSV
jgi:hypothetical protein